MKTAVIVLGNPLAYAKEPMLSVGVKFYDDLEALLNKEGFQVLRFESEPRDDPPPMADVWVAHSRGAWVAPIGAQMGVPVILTGTKEPGSVNHPGDTTVLGKPPCPEHFTLTAEMVAEMRERLRNLPAPVADAPASA